MDVSTSAKRLARLDDAALREALRHCPPSTYYAACQYRLSGDPSRLKEVVSGVIERFAPREHRHKLSRQADAIRLSEDLGYDSLTLIETVALLEEVLKVDISNEELTQLRTLADVQRFVEAKASALVSPSIP